MEQIDSIEVSLFWQQPAAKDWNRACLQIWLKYLLSTYELSCGSLSDEQIFNTYRRLEALVLNNNQFATPAEGNAIPQYALRAPLLFLGGGGTIRVQLSTSYFASTNWSKENILKDTLNKTLKFRRSSLQYIKK